MNVRCPHCDNETKFEDNPFRPFCSERCKLIDLGRWAEGDYRIPDKTPLNESEMALIEKHLEEKEEH